ncbi:MAG: N-glycosylase/DNA lyase [Elusimicrobiota bacterium]|jgi:N-glycosylase/DNA lyase|nr:N-glycosylase/DNA lyase [Elusimicrobiota bacterium]
MNKTIQISFLKTPTAQIETLAQLKKYWQDVKPLINQRQEHFFNVWRKASNAEIFAELVFCLFTPQSRATTCWNAVCNLASKNLIFTAEAQAIAANIAGVRFANNKSRFVVLARDFFAKNGKMTIKNRLKAFEDIYQTRKFLIENIKGIGYKEAGHFLRNIGIGQNLAILDRHILKNLVKYGALTEIPKSLTPAVYENIERRMLKFSRQIDIPMGDLDMLLWCKESGGIFK